MTSPVENPVMTTPLLTKPPSPKVTVKVFTASMEPPSGNVIDKSQDESQRFEAKVKIHA